MNKHTHLIILCIAGLFGCSNPETQEQTSEIKNPSFSKDFKPASFMNDQRVAFIQSLAPAIDSLIAAHGEERHIPGIAYGIVVDDKLVIASSTGLINIEKDIPALPTSDFRIASMTKSFTAMAILKLRDEGKLSLCDPASDYIPEMSGLEYLTGDAPVIDIENLLTMTAGFPEDNPWGDRQLDESDDMLMNLVEEGISFSNPPSYGYEYSNTGYALLGNIVSRVSGMPYQQYIRENIFVPLGMTQTYWEVDNVPDEQLAIGYRWEDDQWKLEPMLHDGSYGAMGGLITTIEDFSKYVSLHLSAWPPRSDPDTGPVKRSTLREMHTPQFARLYADATDYNDESCAVMSGYGFGLGIAVDCHDLKRVSHGGALPGFGSNYVFFPEYGIGLMSFGNRTYTSPWPLGEIMKLIFDNEGLSPRQLPVSEILNQRKSQVAALIQDWDQNESILAENFYLDQSKEDRLEELQEVMAKAGTIQSVGDLEPVNQLRGRFNLVGENGTVGVFFTLTPEKSPKVQRLDVWLDDE